MANNASNLSAFLAQNVERPENRKLPASPRFKGEGGKPIQWEICGIDASENVQLRKQCMRQVPVAGGRKGQTVQVFDAGKYQLLVSARCTVYPNLNSAELQDSYGVHSAEDLLGKMLLPGEFEDYSTAVLEHCGFQGADELVDEAKN